MSQVNVHYSGAEIMRTLRDETFNRADQITVVDFTAAIEIIKNEKGEAAGAVLMNIETGEIRIAKAKVVIIATGGAGRMHYQGFPTSNHYGATADGLVIAYRAGAKLLYQDSLQYHPTGAAYPTQILGKLVTEKVRSLGAKLINKDGEVEAQRVVASIKQRLSESKRQPRDFAILFRTNEQPRAFEMELRSANIPYTVSGGQSFFDRKEVKDVVSYLKTLVRPHDDVALLRVINTPPRGLGSTTLGKFREFAITNKTSLWNVLKPDSPVYSTLDSKAAEAAVSFVKLIQIQSANLRRSFTPEAVDEFLDEVRYKDELERLYPDESERKERNDSVGEVITAVAAYLKEHPNGTLVEFLDDASLGGPDFSSQQEKKSKANAVALSTYHAAKGLEFKEVYMVGMEEGILPHKRSLEDVTEEAVEEERRLCYVGVTRAQYRLTLSLALGRFTRGKLKPTVPSRFLYELTGQAENPRYLNIKNGVIRQGSDPRHRK